MSEPALHLTAASRSWPEELSWIEAPPDELWVRGDVQALGIRPRVAVVGSRSPTPYGLDQARRFAGRLAAHGVAIVSGLARGIDQAAHTAALDAGGVTVAVLGSGVDRPWPEGRVTERVLAEGVVLSELAPGTGPRRHHFPRRNRLISGLSQACLVVEAAHASGSLITARWAADQGRSVLAVPGRVDHPMARGCHRLLREGALLAERPEDVLSELGWPPAHPGQADAPAGEEPPRDSLHPLCAALVGETLSADELAARSGRSPAEVLAELVQLELLGEVARGPGGLYRRTDPRARRGKL